MAFNHTLKDISTNFNAKTGSRVRVRVPVSGTRWVKIVPGTKVNVQNIGTKVVVTPAPNTKGLYNYTVEKDGAIRFPAWKFGLSNTGIKIKSDSLTGKVLLSH